MGPLILNRPSVIARTRALVASGGRRSIPYPGATLFPSETSIVDG